MWKIVVTVLFVVSGEADGSYEHPGRFATEAECIRAIHRDIGDLIEFVRENHPGEDFRLDASCQKADLEAHRRPQ